MCKWLSNRPSPSDENLLLLKVITLKVFFTLKSLIECDSWTERLYMRHAASHYSSSVSIIWCRADVSLNKDVLQNMITGWKKTSLKCDFRWTQGTVHSTHFFKFILTALEVLAYMSHWFIQYVNLSRMFWKWLNLNETCIERTLNKRI